MESVVLVDEAGYASGTADKTAVHHAQTPLHLAFSCYLFNEAGQFLLTRRAESKRTWPGVWTNTCCGHPLPGEPMSGGVLRRLREELGISAAKLTLVLPRFRYQARMANGVLENELCPVYAAYTADCGAEPARSRPGGSRGHQVGGLGRILRSGAHRPAAHLPVVRHAAPRAHRPRLAAAGLGPADAADMPPAALG